MGKTNHRNHDDVIKWKHFPRNWPFVRGIHRSPVNSPHKGQWRGALMFALICVWINGWVNNREAGDLRRHRAHYDVIVMVTVNKVEVRRVPEDACTQEVALSSDTNFFVIRSIALMFELITPKWFLLPAFPLYDLCSVLIVTVFDVILWPIRPWYNENALYIVQFMVCWLTEFVLHTGVDRKCGERAREWYPQDGWCVCIHLILSWRSKTCVWFRWKACRIRKIVRDIWRKTIPLHDW